MSIGGVTGVDEPRTDPAGHFGLPARRAGALRRRPQTGSVPGRDPWDRSSTGCRCARKSSRAWTAPRESMRLVQVRRRDSPADHQDGHDQTDRLRGFARRRRRGAGGVRSLRFRVEEGLAHLRPRTRVKVYGTGSMPLKAGRGLFADALATRFPRLPIEEEGRLNDSSRRHLHAIECPPRRVTDAHQFASCEVRSSFVSELCHIPPRDPGVTPSFTGTRRCTSMLRNSLNRNCVGGIRCASARVSRINFQASAFNHSAISPF